MHTPTTLHWLVSVFSEVLEVFYWPWGDDGNTRNFLRSADFYRGLAYCRETVNGIIRFLPSQHLRPLLRDSSLSDSLPNCWIRIIKHYEGDVKDALITYKWRTWAAGSGETVEEALFELSSEGRIRIAWGFGWTGEQLEHMLQGRRMRLGSDHRAV